MNAFQVTEQPGSDFTEKNNFSKFRSIGASELDDSCPWKSTLIFSDRESRAHISGMYTEYCKQLQALPMRWTSAKAPGTMHTTTSYLHLLFNQLSYCIYTMCQPLRVVNSTDMGAALVNGERTGEIK